MLEGLPAPDETLHDFRPGRSGAPIARRENQVALLERYGLQPSSRVLEIGCGVGWLAYDLTSRLTEGGVYRGVDVSEAVITWLNDNYASRLPNFHFDLLDVKSARYRPKGARKPERVRFPYEDSDFDIVCSFNVFVYIAQRGVANYLREVARVLHAGGTGLLTFKAVIDGDLGPLVGKRGYTAVGKGVYTRRPEHDGWAMAYDDTLIRSMIDDAGLETRAFELGGWHQSASEHASGAARDGPDLYVVTLK